MVVQTVGPTGATAVEAALQLAQRIRTSRRHWLLGRLPRHDLSRRVDLGFPRGSRDERPLEGFVALPYVEHVTDNDLELLERTLTVK